MSSISAELRLRPTRIGFLVDPTDAVSVRLCMNVCACLWGGVYNPIIPICSTIPDAWVSGLYRNMTGEDLAKGYVRFFEPDVFVEATPGLAARLGINDAELDFSQKRIVPLSAFLEAAPEGRSWPPLGMGVGALYRALYEKEFKFVARQNHRVALCKPSNDIDAAFVDAVCGSFPAEGYLAHHARDYQEAFDPITIKATPKNWEKALRESYRFPLGMGRHGLERFGRGAGIGGPTLFIADPSSILDLIDLWNLRLFQPNVVPINSRWLAAFAPFMGEFITANFRPLPGNPNGVMLRTTVEFARSIGEARADAMREEAKLSMLPTGSWSYKLWYQRIWEEDLSAAVLRPTRARITARSESLDLAITETERERSVRFRGLSPDFAPEFRSNSAGWVNVLQFKSYGANSELALSLPTDFQPVRTYKLRTGGIVLSSREGWVLPQRYRDHTEFFTLCTGREAITDWLKQHGITADISKAGRVAEQVIGALKGLHGGRLLAHRDTIQLLERMAKSVRRYLDGTVEEYQDRTAAATAWTALIAKRSKEVWSQNLSLDDFVERNILKLGLGIQCSHCSNANWYSISELNESVVCDRCRKSYPFPQGSIGFTKSPWKFRVVGPFSVPDYADGAYATVLTLRAFSQSLTGMHATVVYTPGLDLAVEGEPPMEVDFALWYSGESMGLDESEAITVFGESKSFGTKCFHEEDIARMRRLAERFPGAFIVFAALKDELHEDERRAIAEFAAWGREPIHGTGRPRAPVMVLTGIELFAPWKIDDAWKSLGGVRQELAEAAHVRLENLWVLADATQQAYLGMKGHSQELMEQWEAHQAATQAAVRPPSKKQKSAAPRRKPALKRAAKGPAATGKVAGKHRRGTGD